MAGKVYKLGLASGARLDVEEVSLARAILMARVKAGNEWLAATQVTSGAFVIDLTGSVVHADLAVTGTVTFSPSTDRLPYRYTMLAVTADGSNVPAFTGFTKWGGSLDWDNTAGKVNYVMFFSDGVNAYYSLVPAL